MQTIARLFRPRPQCQPSNRFRRDAAFDRFPRKLGQTASDPWRVDFWKGELPKTPGVTHLLAVSHLRKVPDDRMPDRRSPVIDASNPTATHEFFLLFVEPPASDRNLVWRSRLDLGHALLQEATAALAAAQARYATLNAREDSRFGDGLHAAHRALQEVGKARARLAASELQVDRCARSVCEAIAHSMETATFAQLIRANDKQVDRFWSDVAGFAALQCEHHRAGQRKTSLADVIVEGVILD